MTFVFLHFEGSPATARSGLFLLEFHGSRIHAVPHAGGFRTIGEEVPQVGVAAAAENFRPAHAKLIVELFLYVLFVDGLIEARPTCPGIELRGGIEQLLAA